jgi:hypothetical protein
MTEDYMPSKRFNYSLTLLFLLTVVLYVAACGGGSKGPMTTGKGQDSFQCGDQTVGVVPNDGTSPKDVYLCKGDKLTWIPNGHTFVVTFPKKSPFEGSPTVFKNDPQNPSNPVVSPAAIFTGSIVVYHYDITVDGVQASDPQVVGGGSHSN